MKAEQRAEMEKLAKAASQGPWTHEGTGYTDNGGRYEGIMSPVEEICGEWGGPSAENAAFIAAANPAKVLDLLATIARLEAERKIVSEYDAHDWWKAVVGDGYKPAGAIPSIKHLNPVTLKEVFDRHAGTEVADVICALLFKHVITENREQFLTKYERDRADHLEAEAVKDGEALSFYGQCMHWSVDGTILAPSPHSENRPDCGDTARARLSSRAKEQSQ